MSAESVDTVMGDGVTVTARAPGAWHPECGSHPENPALIKPATKRGGVRPGAGRPPRSVRIAPGVDGPRAYCVEVHPRRENGVEAELLRLGFEALAPQFLDMVPAQVARVRTMREVLRPAFPGYVVVKFDRADPGWRRIASVRGVWRIMGPGPEQPSPLLAVSVAWIVGQFGPDGAQRRSRLAGAVVAEPLVVGAVVTISSGPMEGCDGVVLASDGRAVTLRLAGGMKVRMAQVLICA